MDGNNGWMEKGENKTVKYFFRFWSWLERGGRWQNWSYRGHCDHSQVQPYIHTFFFIVTLSSEVLNWAYIPSFLPVVDIVGFGYLKHSTSHRLTQDNCIKNGIQMTSEAKEEELAPAISQSTILKESLMWDILRLKGGHFPKSKMIQ